MKQLNLQSHLTETIQISDLSQDQSLQQGNLMPDFLCQTFNPSTLTQQKEDLSQMCTSQIKAPQMRKRSFKGYNSRNRNRASWSLQEDQILFRLKVEKQSWSQIAKQINYQLYENRQVKDAKQVRERWTNYLNPYLKSKFQDLEGE